MGDEIDWRQKELLITLFPSRELTTYSLGKALGVDPSAAKARAEKLLGQDGCRLLEVEERREDNMKKFYYSLTDEGRERTRSLVEDEIRETRDRLVTLEEKLAIYVEQKNDLIKNH